MKKKRGKHGSAITDMLPGLIIACVILVILVVTITILKGNGIDIIAKIKDVILGGRVG
jgi:hypothetical protein